MLRLRNRKNSSSTSEFLKPLENVLRVYMQIEILTASNFNYADLYIQYMCDISGDWKYSDPTTLYGITPICKTKEGSANFGYYFEICLEIDIRKFDSNNELPRFPCLYFEVISEDTWNRYRCEGLAYKYIPVFQPGLHECELQCIKMHPKSISGNLRRYFIGDYCSIDDITWLALPRDHQESTLNKFGVLTESSGSILIRMNILKQSLTVSNERNFDNNLHSHPLLRSFEEILLNYQRAKEKLLEVRRSVLEEK